VSVGSHRKRSGFSPRRTPARYRRAVHRPCDVTAEDSAMSGAPSREELEALPADDLGALRRFGVQKTWRAGETIFRQGHHPEVLFIIEQGEVSLVDETKNERLIVQIVRKGSIIGESSVLTENPYAYTAVARTETTALGFSLDTIRALLEIDPQICFRWLRLLSDRLDGSQRRLVAVAGRSAIERLGSFLL
jgi:CRP-like cAMP-binding protein